MRGIYNDIMIKSHRIIIRNNFRNMTTTPLPYDELIAAHDIDDSPIARRHYDTNSEIRQRLIRDTTNLLIERDKLMQRLTQIDKQLALMNR